MLRFVAFTFGLLLATSFASAPAKAQDSGLKRLDTGEDSKGWEAVGRLDLAGKGFCTGALIAPVVDHMAKRLMEESTRLYVA